jgi:hypothetical protein
MTPDLDTQLREAFTTLREADPRRDPAAVVAAAAARRRNRFQRRTALTAGGVATAVVVAVLAAPPAPDQARPTLDAVLRSAAAVAADQPPLAPTDGYRYTRSLAQDTFYLRRGGREATITVQRSMESWENAQLEGREDAGTGRVIARDGDPVLAKELAADYEPELTRSHSISARIAHGGLGPVPDLAELPPEPAALQAALERIVRNGTAAHAVHWAPGLPTDAMVRHEILGHAMRLLTSAAAPPRLRAAAFLMLGRIPGARLLGPKTDPRGRKGEAIAITIHSDHRYQPSRETEITFDPDTSEVLATSGRTLDPTSGAVTSSGSSVVEATGQVPEVGNRP